jgi:6-pyruvoyltetrahydropterin/6-carboxytetrahydropterin synthase
MKHIIDKSFSFCYGHRVHNQTLDTKFTDNGDACLACRHLHGHEGLIKVFLEETSLETYNDGITTTTLGANVRTNGMVTDFKHLGWFKNFLDDVLDHKMILDLNDPLNAENVIWVLDDDETVDMSCLHQMPEGYWIPDMTKIIESMKKFGSADTPKNKAILEKYEGLIFVDFVPTSENISGWLLQIASEKMKDIPGVRVSAVEYWETPKSHCRVEV